jgi:hypothetical protein
VEIAPAAREWLMLVPERTGRVCPNASIDRIRNIARTAKDAGDNALFPPIPDNAFRHSFISHRVAATGDIPRTSLEAGNSVKIVNQHYRQLVKRQDGEAWFAIRPGDDALAPVVPMKEASA